MKRRLIKLIRWLIVCLFLIYSLSILVTYNAISFIYTILLLLVVWMMSNHLIGKYAGKRQMNFRLLIATSLIMILGLEIILRSTSNNYATYAEKNGSIFYTSPNIPSNFTTRLFKKALLGDLYKYNVSFPGSKSTISKTEFTYEHQFNNLGLREKDISLAKRDGEYRIICLGDSFTEGVGAPADSTWVAQLELNLNARTGQPKYRCLNAGRQGSDPVEAYFLLADTLHYYKPDMVILAVSSPDLMDLSKNGGLERYDEFGHVRQRTGPWWEFLYGTFYTARHIVHDLLKYRGSFLQPADDPEEMVAAHKIMRATVSKFASLAFEKGFELTVVVFPVEYELEMSRLNHGFDRNCRDMGDSLTPEHRFAFLPPCYVNRMFNEKIAPEDLYWKLDRHHNSNGYKLMADCITELIGL
ncbi:MAG: hypothetical protein GY751_17465 [Bacteroidetes bacterium]|nr:hypothetical protein [Bacteroidota bacterium]